MFKKFICLSFFVFSLSIQAQEKNKDIALITITLENYFDGYIQRDAELLNQAFDMDNGAMKVLAKSTNGKETVENNYFKDLIPKWSSREKLSDAVLEDSELKILSIDVVDSRIGSAKISMKVGETTYIDILSLQKINQEWKITNKIFVVQED